MSDGESERETRRMDRKCTVCNETDVAVRDTPLVRDTHPLKGKETWVCDRCGYPTKGMPVEFINE